MPFYSRFFANDGCSKIAIENYDKVFNVLQARMAILMRACNNIDLQTWFKYWMDDDAFVPDGRLMGICVTIDSSNQKKKINELSLAE